MSWPYMVRKISGLYLLYIFLYLMRKDMMKSKRLTLMTLIMEVLNSSHKRNKSVFVPKLAFFIASGKKLSLAQNCHLYVGHMKETKELKNVDYF